jgi:hypothetical protein
MLDLSGKGCETLARRCQIALPERGVLCPLAQNVDMRRDRRAVYPRRLQDAIVIEGLRDAHRNPLCRLRLPCAVQARKSAARLDRERLTISAPKQDPATTAQ